MNFTINLQLTVDFVQLQYKANLLYEYISKFINS